jgi:SpoVK/Ycf46/Vps4 family AAA+-type ATPase
MQERGIGQQSLTTIGGNENPILISDIKELSEYLEQPGNGLTLMNYQRETDLPEPIRTFSISAKNNHSRIMLSSAIRLEHSDDPTVVECFEQGFIKNHDGKNGKLADFILPTERIHRPDISSVAVYVVGQTGLRASTSIGPKRQSIEVTNHLRINKRHKRSGYLAQAPYTAEIDTEAYIHDFLCFSLFALRAVVEYKNPEATLPQLVVAEVPERKRPPLPQSLTDGTPSNTESGVHGASTSSVSKKPSKELVHVKKENLPDEHKLLFKDIVGHEEAKQRLSLVKLARENPAIAEKWGAPLERIMLLYGPFVTKKEKLVEAFANELGAVFMYKQSTDINDKYVAGPAKNVTEIFKKVEKTDVLTVLCLADIDKAFPATSVSSNQEEGAREFVRNLEAIQKNPNVIVMMTADSKSGIHNSVINSGLFDEKIEMFLPEESVREQIWRDAITGLLDELETENFRPFGEIDLMKMQSAVVQFAEKTENLCKEDIENIFRRVLRKKAYEEVLSGSSSSISMNDIENVIDEYIEDL